MAAVTKMVRKLSIPKIIPPFIRTSTEIDWYFGQEDVTTTHGDDRQADTMILGPVPTPTQPHLRLTCGLNQYEDQMAFNYAHHAMIDEEQLLLEGLSKK